MSNLGHWPTGENAGYDDEYTAPGHTEPLDSALNPMPMTLVPRGVFGGGGACANCERLQAENDNLREELRSAREMLELAEERD